MGKITAVKDIKKQGKKAGIYIDGKFVLSINMETAIKERLKTGIEVDLERLNDLRRKDEVYRCRETAERFLGYRPRSENELRERLRKRSYDGNVIDTVIESLREQGLVDDSSFAGFWKENRESFSPRSRYLTRLELKRKGVAEDVIDRTTSSIDDYENAYRIASSRAGRLKVPDYNGFRKRLADFLRRRGFDYEVINQTIEKVWSEKPKG